MSRNADRFRDVAHLGDGTYAGHDGYQVWVWASDGLHETAPVALEPGVLTALVQYAQRRGVYPK